jgi:hypothetical protein
MKVLNLIALLIFPLVASADGTVIGNGGDYVRSTFFRVGESAINYLHSDPDGRRLVTEYNLSLDALRLTLNIKVVTVTADTLRDNRGSIVDAIGTPGSITLNSGAWIKYFEKNWDVTYLVVHEMLRSANVNDDNYVISKHLNPFPVKYRISTSMRPIIDVIDEDKITRGEPVLGGNGCSIDGDVNTIIEFDSENSKYEITPRKYSLSSSDSSLDRKNCTLAIPYQVPKGRRLVITQVDMNAIVDLKSGASLRMAQEFFYAGGTGKLVDRVISAGRNSVKGRALLRSANNESSPCGEDFILRLNTSALLKSTERRSSANVDSISVYVKVEKCKK